MRCKRVKKLFFDYINGNLNENLRKDIAEHLKECSECSREFEIVKTFYENIEIEKVNTPDEMILKLRDKIEKSEIGFFDKIMTKILYPATIIFGLTLGIIVANLLYTPNNYDKTITLLSNNTIIVEPIIDLEGEINE
jgi:hypothetical protein